MRIGFDGGCLANGRGFGRFTRELLEALARVQPSHQFVVIIDKPSLESGRVSVPAFFESIPVAVREAPSQAASASGRRRLGDMIAMGRAAARAQLDAMFFPMTYTMFPIWNVPKLVVTVPDAMPLSHPELIFANGRGRLAWLLKEGFALRRADRILTLSHASSTEIIKHHRAHPDKIRVLPCAASSIFGARTEFQNQRGLTKLGVAPGMRYLLYVGGFSPHKNLPRLMQAFARVAQADTHLVLVGNPNDVFHNHAPELRKLAGQLGIDARVIWTGAVSDELLVDLYRGAIALALPSLVEGFGLTAIEALACGTPVICSRAASIPEVVGDAGIYFDPASVESMCDALRRILHSQDTRAQLAGRALQRAALFSWDATARSLISVFDELAPRGRRGRHRTDARHPSLGPAARIAGPTSENLEKFS